jgi:hypothetical protein
VLELGEAAVNYPPMQGLFQPDRRKGENPGGDQGARIAVIVTDASGGMNWQRELRHCPLSKVGSAHGSRID